MKFVDGLRGSQATREPSKQLAAEESRGVEDDDDEFNDGGEFYEAR